MFAYTKQRQEDKEMKRSEVREHVFKIVFRTAFYPQEEWDEQVVFYLEQLSNSKMEAWREKNVVIEEDKRAYFEYLEKIEAELEPIGKRAKQIFATIGEVDSVIESISEGWKIGRIGKVELAILRVAIFEIQKDNDIPTGVAINEAVELAKVYGTEKSARFINGLLAKLA